MSVILACLFAIFITAILPIVVMVWYKRKTNVAWRAFFVGAICFFVGALVLEQLLHALVFSLVPDIMSMPLLFTVYACLAAGVFEETARFIGLRFLCRKEKPALSTGIAYGIGHGGIESILLAGVSYVISLIQLSTNNLAASAVLTPGNFLLGAGERIFAVTLHICLSVLIWMVVTKRLPFYFYPVSILLHACFNVSAALYQAGVITNVLIVEGILVCSVSVLVIFIYKLYQKTKPQITE